MRTREKIIILLFTVTLALGTIVFLYATEDVLYRFRLLLIKYPVQLMTELGESLANLHGLWYGGIALFAFIVVGLLLKSARDAELQAFRDRLVSIEVAKTELETALQDSLWKEKHARGAQEAAAKDLAASLSRLLDTELELTEKESLLRSRDAELKLLRFQIGNPERSNEPGSQASEIRLREELKEKTEIIEAKDSALKELETLATGKVNTLENQLGVKEELLKERDKEIEALRTQLIKAGLVKTQAESLLAEELKTQQQSLLAKDSALKELEKSLVAKFNALKAELSQKQELLQGRSAELEGLKSEVHTLTARLADVTTAKDRAENVLQQELKKRAEALQSREAAFKEMETNLSAKIYDLENQLSDRDVLVKERDKELETLKTQLTRAGTAKNQAESFLAEELKKQRRALLAKDSALKDLEKSLATKFNAFKAELTQKQELLQGRNAELEGLKSEVGTLTGRLADMASAKERSENVLQQEVKKRTQLLQSRETALKELETNLSAKVHDLENQLSGKDTLIKQHDKELDALKAQLTKTGSAKQEIEALLREELSKTTEVLEAKNSTIKELETTLNKTVYALKHQVSEREMLLKRRDGELEALRSEVDALKTQLVSMGPTAERLENSLRQEFAQASGSAKELEENLRKVQALEGLLREKEDLLTTRDGKIERLESELKEKRKELARHEIEVWQSIERRNSWKRKLAKFGIPLKD
ncbi:MAG: hypothetical protein WCH75_24890 [Candidatus Binatia bacterium]